ncbi:MAG: hypothetical protein ACETWG_13520 [Candidatus Neomarinimicrobiota bacterium]
MVDYKNKEGLIIWQLNFALSTIYEIETEAIEHLVPKRLTPIEVAPGISLLHLAAFNFPEGGLGYLPEFQELVLSLIVTPDLSRGVPQSAMYVLSLGSTCQEHLDHCVNYYKLPVYGQFTKVSLQQDPHSVKYEDGNGPIISMKNIHPNPVYTKDGRYYQAFVKEAGEIYVADVEMKGSLFEHQSTGDAGQMWSHPFFRDIDLETTEPTVYMQTINKPSSIGQQLYPRPEKFV